MWSRSVLSRNDEKILTKKYDESKRKEYLDKKQTEKEETRRAHADKRKRKQEYLDRKLGRSEDTREYYAAKEELWLQEYAPNKRNMVKFKDKMLKGLYDAELKEICLFLCLRNQNGKEKSRQY